MDYTCRIAGDLLICTLIPQRDMNGAIFCFSGMAPMAPTGGGTLHHALGSYTEIALPNLKANLPHELSIRYTGGYTPANRAWMPLGPYVRFGDDIIPLPPTPAGRRPTSYEPSKPFDDLAVIPQPTHWAPSGSSTGEISGFAGTGEAFEAVAGLAQRHGLKFTGSHPVRFVDEDLPTDAYRLTVTTDGVTVGAAGYGGQFNALITLLNLVQDSALPCGEILDVPRFGWRGQHLDTARHYYDPASILALLDLMALLKLNRFHWHFADDEAFRIALDSLPDLAQKTALRGEGQILPALFAGSPCEGGSYSKQTVRDIIAHAAALNIEIMPEIETPAHALALTELYPDTRDPGDNGAETSVQGYRRNALNPAMSETWTLLETIITEISTLFPFDTLHLGCDELPENTWLSSPRARALMDQHGLETTHDLQGWTIAKLAAFTASKGKRPAAWEEAAQGSNGGIGNNAVLFSWTGQGPGLDAARAGYDVVMTPAQHAYLDMAHTNDPDDWGASWAAFVDLHDTIAWDPVPDPAVRDRIIGVQGAFWSEFTTLDDQMWPMLMPRMLGIAMMAWQTNMPDQDTLFALSNRISVSAGGKICCNRVEMPPVGQSKNVPPWR